MLEEDIVIFYYAGHMTNQNNDERDGDGDEALVKDGSNRVITDDELTQKLNAIGRRGTLRLVILDTCYAEAFWTGKNDLKTLQNVAFFL